MQMLLLDHAKNTERISFRLFLEYLKIVPYTFFSNIGHYHNIIAYNCIPFLTVSANALEQILHAYQKNASVSDLLAIAFLYNSLKD